MRPCKVNFPVRFPCEFMDLSSPNSLGCSGSTVLSMRVQSVVGISSTRYSYFLPNGTPECRFSLLACQSCSPPHIVLCVFICRCLECCVNGQHIIRLPVLVKTVALSLTLSTHTLTLTQPHMATPSAG